MTKISVTYNKPVDKLLLKLKAFLKKEDHFEGNENQGSFNINSSIGNFKGKYVVKKEIINIEIFKKPFFISSKIIEGEIKKYLSKN